MNLPPSFTSDVIILLIYFAGICSVLLASLAIVNITRYFVDRKLLRLKHLSVHSANIKSDSLDTQA